MKVGPKIVDEGLVLCLDAANHLCRAGINGSPKDLINGTEGDFVNGSVFDDRKSGVIDLDATNDRVEFSTNVKTADCTIICWANTRITLINTISDMLYNMGEYSRGPDLWFTSSRIFWNTWDGTGNPICYIPDSVMDGKYHCYTLCCDTSTSTATLYINGEQAGTANHQSKHSLRLTETSTFALGGSAGSSGYNWLGAIGMFQIYNRVLSQSEVLQNYEATKQRFI